MLEKLSAIADFADQNSQYAVADDATKIIKEAQLWDALRTLFDPEHTPGLDRSTPFWKRLSKGWARGRMDRHLGLVLAIMTERTKLNKKIENMTAPIKEFQEQVAAFYEKLRSGDVSSDNLREESRGLQGALKDTLKLISGKELRQILKLRERLEAQQLIAAEKIKGLDEETKENLLAVLKGEALPSASPAGSRAPDAAEEAEVSSVDSMKRWLRNQRIPRLSYHTTITTGPRAYAAAQQYREFMELYGIHPKAVLEYAFANTDMQAEGFARYPQVFSEMLRRAQSIIDWDLRGAPSRKGREKEVPGEAKKEEVVVPPASVSPLAAPTIVEPTAAPTIVGPPPVSPTTEKIPLLSTPPASAPAAARTKRDKEMVRELAGAGKRRKGPGGPLVEHPGPTVPEEKVPREVEKSPADDLQLAFSKATRTERQITRLGRVQQLRKLAVDKENLSDQLTAEDYVQHYSVRNRGVHETNPIIGDGPEDIMNVFRKGRETFDEERHLSPEDGHDDEDHDMRRDPELTPEDDDYEHPRDRPVRTISKEERLEQLGIELLSTQRTLNRFRHSMDDELGDYYREDNLKTKKRKLIHQIRELSGLPESWIRTE